ncbi:formylglycine-generating enzyme family protein [Cerasicoccus maritimus]|uniref:formylglycine-generating enzyme family protein n=1 Tax=Cerasicoccus maritimus TaxID=490089 RepID=UPI002852A5AF|nr:SUMF1/EgtB/PvdO family nonheme iron enzyme [Cerasicoccus maritimus]
MKTTILITCIHINAIAGFAAVNFDMAIVGDIGNPAYAAPQGDFGSVPYQYSISKHEVTTTQYAEFLNAVAKTDTHSLYSNGMQTDGSLNGIQRTGSSGSFVYMPTAGHENRPISFVSFWDATRFANWLSNGQPTGSQSAATTEDGAYTLGGVTNPSNLSVTRNTINPNTGSAAGLYFIPSEDEWFKAAYYNSATSSYYLYPTASDIQPIAENPPGGTNSANYGTPGSTFTAVGAYENTLSPYGLYDMAGNAWEYNEGIVSTTNRSFRGSSNGDMGNSNLTRDFQNNGNASLDLREVGFRVSQVPEPQTWAIFSGLVAFGLAWIRHRRS